MSDASAEYGIRQTGSGRNGRKTGGAPILAEMTGIRGVRTTARQPLAQLAVVSGQNPPGVESVPTADEGTTGELGNLAAISPAYRREMIEATDDRRREGRNPRSSPRAEKPLTWRRGIVGKAFQQEVDG